MRIKLWMTARKAAELGCTHHARFLGVVPGFFSPDESLWVARSDLLAPIEDLLSWLWVGMHELRGEEPDFLFMVGEPIYP